jgi:hypothetical protein
VALKKDLSSLSSVPSGGGELPVKHPTIGPLLAQAWADAFVDTDEHPLALPMSHENARIRFSWAGMCGRRIGYSVMGEPETNPSGPADHWRFGLGHLVHDQMQQVVQAAFPGAEVEVHTQLEDGLLAGHADVEITDGGTVSEGVSWTKKISVEIKTINGFGFKKAVGARGAAEGPRIGAKIQGALNAVAGNCDELVILYLSMENLSPREAKNIGADEIGRFCAEWHYTRDEFEPWAEAERERFLGILATVDAGSTPDRYIPHEMPPGAVIDDPFKGQWVLREGGALVDAGSTWMCGYCPFADRCIDDEEAERLAV